MQTIKFDIRLFLADQELQNVLEDIPHCEDCEQVITSAQLFSASDVARADLVIFDAALVPAHTLRKVCPKRTILILCTKLFKNPDAVPDLYTLVDEIWVQPLSLAYAKARFVKNIQLLVKQKNLPGSPNTPLPESASLPDLIEIEDDSQAKAEQLRNTQIAEIAENAKIAQSSYSTAFSWENDSLSCIDVEKGTISFVFNKDGSHESPAMALPYTQYLQELCKAHVRPEDGKTLHSAMKLETIMQALAQQPLHTAHFHTQDSAGSVRQKRIQCSYIPEEPRLICMVIADITETARTEQRRNTVLRRALEAAEKSSKAKRAFLTTLSHEIRTPMNTIIGVSEILLDKDLAPDIARKISIIQNVGTKLLGIINDILIFSRMETGKAEQQEKSCLSSSGVSSPPPPLPAPIEGIDLEKVLSTYPRLEIYYDIIKVYAYDIATRAPQLQQFLLQEDMEAFSLSVHTLKSISRGVGATALADAAEKLETLAATGQLAAVQELFPPFMQALDVMVGNVGRYVRQYLHSPDCTLPKQQLEMFDNSTVDALKTACTALDYDLAEVIVDELDLYVYPEPLQDLLNRMKKCCVDFDYTELRTLTATLT